MTYSIRFVDGPCKGLRENNADPKTMVIKLDGYDFLVIWKGRKGKAHFVGVSR